ncbi:helix-turn-helix transcriptional regulator [Thalassotalea piscium]|uniref:Putative DNA-binding transcriptional regulator AlpA n=1 Tax=Thalassotalea piscium TaxID=1230533 RepID=A0A7X0NHF2_9GAMM|nr:AlpA family phage regulatory protein [Thalassotalea piscium]MBB6543366.1 putative DNA-binding transcriptional regulator AlpA [Thalassotalea piscium]
MNHTEHHIPAIQLATQDLQIIRKPQALKMLGISKSNFHIKINEGLLPAGINLGANSVGYFKHELTAVIIAMATSKTQEEIKNLVKGLLEQRHNLLG